MCNAKKLETTAMWANDGKQMIPTAVYGSVIIGIPATVVAIAYQFPLLGVVMGVMMWSYIATNFLGMRPKFMKYGGFVKSDKKPVSKRVAVIGAGPVGLVTLKELTDAGHNVSCFEGSNTVGGTFASCYKSAKLTSSPFVTAFSDYPPKKTDHDHYPAKVYVEYLSNYAKNFSVYEKIRFNTMVKKVQLNKKTGQSTITVTDITTGTSTTEVFDYVAVCSGLHVKPNIPVIKGVETFKGKIVHSKDYDTPDEFKGKNVVVIGLGETSADVAAEIGDCASTAFLSSRSGAFVVSRKNYETGLNNDYDSNRLRYSLPKWLHNLSADAMRSAKYYSGLMSEGEIVEFQLLKASKKGAFSQFATKSDHFIPRLVNGSLKLVSQVEKIEGSKVTFTDGNVMENCDAILLCTGFDTSGSLFGNIETEGAEESVSTCSCPSQMYKYMFPVTQPGLAFLGTARPHIGAIPPIAEIQARCVAKVVSGELLLPSEDEMKAEISTVSSVQERDFDGRLKTLVNWIPYSDSLAEAVGCKVGGDMWLKDPKLAFKMLTGPFSAAHFRLVGTEAKPEIARDTIMSLPTSMPVREICWYFSLHVFSSLFRLGGANQCTRTACTSF
eukprot:TRINITY_DN409_c0_g2_i1.p1 TRINITY_DN409_c0_g2~~TRINITY_DN409_c0_g2_i1.p1  ORF type:complete len:629 (+),score=145.10 TRINITY_DN409_c0_g2_i1:58-1887(+)